MIPGGRSLVTYSSADDQWLFALFLMFYLVELWEMCIFALSLTVESKV